MLLTFDGPPGTLMIGPQMSLWCSQHIARLEIENCGAARHIVPEDQPDAIGTAIARWIDRHQLGTLR
ncbi:MAG TPA: hypothetical protein VN750_10480 [Steroidobacteraceae bacterium]|nr:hypothetical protein [Steroidobacteraceae bacterium]